MHYTLGHVALERLEPGSSFDAAFEALAQLPRMFVEPDGSFVWPSGPAQPSWQLDGQLVEGREGLAYVELKGDCPAEALTQLMHCCGAATCQVVLLEQGTRLAHDEWLVRLAR